MNIYYETKNKEYSILSLGFLLNAILSKRKVAYVSNKSQKVTNFLENLCLSKKFSTNVDYLDIETYFIKKDGLILKSSLPQVEFYNLRQDQFFKELNYFDEVILDTNSLEKNQIEEIRKLKNTNHLILSTQIEEKIIKVSHHKQHNLFTNKFIQSFKEENSLNKIYAYGSLLDSFLKKENSKLIIYENYQQHPKKDFFFALKQWSIHHPQLYGNFDYVKLPLEEDKELQNKNALELTLTSLKKISPIFLINFDLLEKKLIDYNSSPETLLKHAKKKVLTHTKKTSPEISQIASEVIEFKQLL